MEVLKSGLIIIFVVGFVAYIVYRIVNHSPGEGDDVLGD